MQNDKDMERELITVAVEYALLQMGPPELELVENRLKNNFNCTIGDCLDHPESLQQTLNELFGNCYEDILDNIKQVVSGAVITPQVEGFLTVLKIKQLAA